MAVWAMQAGKDVYVEKPCSHNVHEGRVITQWARKLGRMCQMGVQSRSMTGMRQTLDFVQQRQDRQGHRRAGHLLPPPRQHRTRSTAEAPIPDGLDFDLWCGPAPKVVPQAQTAALRLALGLGNRQRRPGQPEPARAGQGPLGTGQAGAAEARHQPRRPAGLHRRRRRGQQPGHHLRMGRRLADLRRARPADQDAGDLRSEGPGRSRARPTSGTARKATPSAPNYFFGRGLRLRRAIELGKWSGGEYQAHFANFVKAIRSRDHKDLHLDIEDGHLSSALAHLGNVSLSDRQSGPGRHASEPAGGQQIRRRNADHASRST